MFGATNDKWPYHIRDTIRLETVIGQGSDVFELVGQPIDEATQEQLKELLPDTEIPEVATTEFMEAVLTKLTELSETDLAELLTGNDQSSINIMKGLADGASSFVDFAKQMLDEFLQKKSEQ